MAVITVAAKAAGEGLVIPDQTPEQAANPDQYYLAGDMTWRDKSEITSITQVFDVGGGSFANSNTSTGNLWIKNDFSPSSMRDKHLGAVTVQSNAWFRLNPEYLYECEAFLVSNSTGNGTISDYEFRYGGSWGHVNTPTGTRGQIHPYRTSATNDNSLWTSVPARAVITGQTFLSVGNASTQTLTIWSGNDYYAPSHVVITCLGKA